MKESACSDNQSMSLGEADNGLIEFLQVCSEVAESASQRVRCQTCNASRSLYCPDCYKILVPKDFWPKAICDGSLRLPFDVDIILNDRRTASTGVQVATVLSASEESQSEKSASHWRLFDQELNEEIPDYKMESNTFLLFPGKSSRPISLVARDSTIRRVVVLDSRWSKAKLSMYPSLLDLPCVHLDSQPNHSYYWRWHNAGEGMLSTVEAIYFSAWEVAKAQGWEDDERKNLKNLLWLFGLQREVIRRMYEKDGGEILPVHLPFSQDGKEMQRARRRKQGAGTHGLPREPQMPDSTLPAPELPGTGGGLQQLYLIPQLQPQRHVDSHANDGHHVGHSVSAPDLLAVQLEQSMHLSSSGPPPPPQPTSPNQDYADAFLPHLPTMLAPGCFNAQVLVPDSMIGSILGRRSSTLAELETLSGTRMLVSLRGEFVPGTRLRIVTIRGPTAQSVCQAQFLMSQRLILPPTAAYSPTHDQPASISEQHATLVESKNKTDSGTGTSPS
jgi:DTW domain-containing protein YfiP